MNVDQYYQSPSNALKASDIPPGSQVQVTIEKCEEVMFKGDDGKETPKLRISFVGKEKGLILNKTNAMAISHVYGPDTDSWPNKQIILFSTKVSYAGDMVDAIRVNVPLQDVPDEAVPF